MGLFNYKGLTISVFNNGGKEAVDFIQPNTSSPIKFISGDRVEFMYGGGKFIYHVRGVNFDTISGSNMVYAESIFVNPMPDGSQVVIKNNSFNYTVSTVQFEGMSSLQSLPESTILKTMFMHLVNGLLARIPELGGTTYGGGMEYFNNDGTIDTPLFTYTLNPQGESLDMTIVPNEQAVSWKLLVNGSEAESFELKGLVDKLYQIEYQILDENGEVAQSQARNIII
jgi:hypothetical protein